MPEAVGTTELAGDLVIRAAAVADVPAVTRLDSRITGMTKPDYWADMFERYGKRPNRFFLIAEGEGAGVIGFIIGEVRAWEFGSPPSGWIFALGVDPTARLNKIGSRLFEAMCGRLAESGVDMVRTMLARDDELNMAFFRSQGMMGGPFIQLEMSLYGFAGGHG
ncbi:MAG: GNAT family N-acetyltransferase [Rhodospirillales bacterium]|nr:GNAT family N-acetyltransferase [Rhodospirillales bacterium]MDH3791463.1 GNAT family N-acetyltransferase [Rhodospirillales bacterium]MDH3909771.1 GNAT family N-acetyltransferase [Rhodospirillales bacterium]MDH3917473.1 GNAT family N-acetyltransferase [Rhodospirillales bacterium]MDH3967794.1 GNAT family N-acetyltransferase [Rhodospirillales bacterium]